MPKPLPTTCGTLVTDGTHLLLGHATGSPRWDIPKGMLEPGELPRQAAVRELAEETGLHVPPDELIDLGLHAYLPRKNLALFMWRVAVMPDPAVLVCTSLFVDRWGRTVPEFDRFAVVDYRDTGGKVGRSLAAVLEAIPWR